MGGPNRIKNRKIVSKVCVKCGKVLPLDRFYGHKEWASQCFRDAWCKDCAGKHCVNKEGAREYMWYNNRAWSDTYWDMAMKKSLYALASDEEYLLAKDEDKKQRLQERMAGRYFFSIINLGSVYRYSENIGEEGVFREFNPESTAETDEKNAGAFIDDGELIYSRTWNGMYTQREISYLDEYYAQLEEGFVLDNHHARDSERRSPAGPAIPQQGHLYAEERFQDRILLGWYHARQPRENRGHRRKPGSKIG